MVDVANNTQELRRIYVGKAMSFAFVGHRLTAICDDAFFGDDGTPWLCLTKVDGAAKAAFVVARIRCTEVSGEAQQPPRRAGDGPRGHGGEGRAMMMLHFLWDNMLLWWLLCAITVIVWLDYESRKV